MIKGKELILKNIDTIPENSGIYKFLKENNEILYIGKAKNLKKRVLSYSRDDISYRIGLMLNIASNIEYIITKNEAEALLLEAVLIKKIQPRYNILLKDDKSFPYILLKTDHEYPMLIQYRGKNLEEGKYFGPFTSSKDMLNTIIEIQKIFKIRNCSDNYFKNRKRPCLQYQIRRCSAPCVNKISQEEYKGSFNQAKAFLQGKNHQLQKELSTKMLTYSNNLEYEKAKEIRDKIKAISTTQMRSGEGFVVSDADIITMISLQGKYIIQVMIYRAGFYFGSKSYFPSCSNNEKDSEIMITFLAQFYQSRIPPKTILTNIIIDDSKESIIDALYDLHKTKIDIIYPKNNKLKELMNIAQQNSKNQLEQQIAKTSNFSITLDSIKDMLKLPITPSRIEIFDNSHIMGSHAIGAMVVFTGEGFAKKEYRTYNIRMVQDGDDYGMLKEVMNRRLTKISESKGPSPDLIIIDGGKGHFNVVSNLMEKYQLKIPFISISKGKDRNAGNETIYSQNQDAFNLDNDSNTSKQIQIMRDQAHNFAITTYRKKHRKSLNSSVLEKIPGIGNLRRKKLMNYFGSYESVKKATIEDLARIEGISKNLAKKIFSVLQDD
jgi:excinuclease ABC subunit C